MNRRRHKLIAAALAVAAGAAAGQDPEGLLSSRIAITWNDSVQGLGAALADRMGIPFTDTATALAANVTIQQVDAPVAETINAVNKQLPVGYALQLTGDGPQAALELRSTQAVQVHPLGTASNAAMHEVGSPSRAEVENLFATSGVSTSGSWVDQARRQWTASFAPAPTASKAEQRWELKLSDVTLHRAFQRWAKDAGYRVVWDARKHVLVSGPDVFSLGFEEAISAVLSTPGIQASEYPLEVCFYPNSTPVARITRRGDQDKECK